MIRFVVAPDGVLVPDIAAKLPGVGHWVIGRRDLVGRAVTEGLLVAAAEARGAVAVSVAPDLADQVASLLDCSCLALLGLARRAGKVVLGYEKVARVAARDQAAAVILAVDASPATRQRARRQGNHAPVIELWPRRELSLAMGRENVVHAAVIRCGLGQRFVAEAARRRAFDPVTDMPGDGNASDGNASDGNASDGKD